MITTLINEHCELGENPLWRTEDGCLFWTDITGGKLHRFHLESRKHNVIYRGAPVEYADTEWPQWRLAGGRGSGAHCSHARRQFQPRTLRTHALYQLVQRARRLFGHAVPMDNALRMAVISCPQARRTRNFRRGAALRFLPPPRSHNRSV